MNPHIMTFDTENTYQDFMKVQAKIDHFYRQLNMDLEMKMLRIV